MDPIEKGRGAFKLYMSLHLPWLHRIFVRRSSACECDTFAHIPV